jgi:LytS/YehU family sensor histidine kinase
MLPTMLLQPSIENSIKHGMARKQDGKGLIELSVTQNGALSIVIKDNGVGRTYSRLPKIRAESNYEPKGMAITQNRVEMLNRMYDTDIRIWQKMLQLSTIAQPVPK